MFVIDHYRRFLTEKQEEVTLWARLVLNTTDLMQV